MSVLPPLIHANFVAHGCEEGSEGWGRGGELEKQNGQIGPTANNSRMKEGNDQVPNFRGTLATISGKCIVLELKSALDKFLSELRAGDSPPRGPRKLQSGVRD